VGIQLTEDQRYAVATIDRDCVVTAGAGSGKTRVLVERYMRLLEEGYDVDEIVAITFTRKAAMEMKERIRKGILERLQGKKPTKLSSRDLHRINNKLVGANITTIHGFCSRILRENPVESGIDPRFTLLDTAEMDFVIEDCIKDILEEGIEEDDESLLQILEYFGVEYFDKAAMVYTLKKVFNTMRSLGYDVERAAAKTFETLKRFDVDSYFAAVKNQLLQAVDTIHDAVVNGRSRSKKAAVYLKHNQWHKIRTRILSAAKYSDVCRDVQDLKAFAAVRKEKEAADKIKEILYNLDLLSRDTRNFSIYPHVFRLLKKIEAGYEDYKSKRGLMDYEDLQIKTLSLFQQRPDVVEKYRAKFKHIMVDEFQDTNRLQKAIIDKLRGRLFVVGDEKQSIYRFRGARVKVFREIKEEISKTGGEVVSLSDNFRTQKRLLYFINSIFKKLMGKDFDPLKHNRCDGGRISVEILRLPEEELKDIPEDEINSSTLREMEARLIARRIKEMVEEGEIARAYRDIAVLFRAMSSVKIYEKALQEYDIPYYIVSGRGFYNSQEIVDVVNLLKVLEDPDDVLSFVGVLRSPMFCVSDTSIARLSQQGFDPDMAALESEEKQAVIRAQSIIQKLSQVKNLLKLKDLVEMAYDLTHYPEIVLLQKGGRQKMANLNKLLDVAEEFDARGNHNLTDFIHYIEKLMDREVDESEARIQDEKDNTVKVMTIHQAKGLEFPVVVLPELGRAFPANSPMMLFNDEMGLAIKGRGEDGEFSSSSSYYYSKVYELEKAEEEEELKRILYVAITRAKDYVLLGFQPLSKQQKRDFINLLEGLWDGLECVKEVEDFQVLEANQQPANIEFKKPPAKTHHSTIFEQIHPIKSQGELEEFSVSHYLHYNRCPRMFYLSFFLQLPDPRQVFKNLVSDTTSAVEKGAVVHNIIENINRTDNPEDIVKILDEEVKPYIENYLASPLFKSRKKYCKIMSELPFTYVYKGFKIKGVVDEILIKEKGRAAIVDFKTSYTTQQNIKELVEHYKPQLFIYAAAVEEILGLVVEEGVLHFLHNGYMETLPLAPQQKEDALADFVKFCQRVNQTDRIADYPPAENKCSQCGYSLICRNMKLEADS